MTADSARPRIGTVAGHIRDTLGAPVDYVPSGQNSVRLQAIRVAPAGTAAGVAVDLALLGADVATFGAVGDDEVGAFLLSSLRGHGIDTAGVVRLDGIQTSASILLVRPTATGRRFTSRAPTGSRRGTIWVRRTCKALPGCTSVA